MLPFVLPRSLPPAISLSSLPPSPHGRISPHGRSANEIRRIKSMTSSLFLLRLSGVTRRLFTAFYALLKLDRSSPRPTFECPSRARSASRKYLSTGPPKRSAISLGCFYDRQRDSFCPPFTPHDGFSLARAGVVACLPPRWRSAIPIVQSRAIRRDFITPSSTRFYRRYAPKMKTFSAPPF